MTIVDNYFSSSDYYAGIEYDFAIAIDSLSFTRFYGQIPVNGEYV